MAPFAASSIARRPWWRAGRPLLLLLALLGPALARAESVPSTASADPEATPPEASPAAAEMLKSMREKGVLSEEEYEDLYRRQARWEAKQRQEAETPGWMKDWTFGGDMRLRLERFDYGGFDDDDDGLEPGDDNVDTFNDRAIDKRNRARARVRLGAEKKVGAGLGFGFRVATSEGTIYGSNTARGADGGANFGRTLEGDPRSSNVSFGRYFSPKYLYFDRFYMKYEPTFAPTLRLAAGKVANPFTSNEWSSDIFVWDHDINPEGVTLDYRFDLVPEKVELRGVFGGFLIDEIGEVTIDSANDTEPSVVFPDRDDEDPYLFAYQLGVKATPLDWLKLGSRVSYYDYQKIGARMSAALMDFGNGGEAIHHNPIYRALIPPGAEHSETGRSRGDLQQLVVDGFMSFTPFGETWKVTPFVQWTSILNAAHQDEGWVFGVDLGTPDVLKISLIGARMQRNATVSIFTDSDFFDGFTNVRGWGVVLERKLTRSLRVRGTYLNSRLDEEACAAEDAGLPSAFCEYGGNNSALERYRSTSADRERWQIDLMMDF